MYELWYNVIINFKINGALVCCNDEVNYCTKIIDPVAFYTSTFYYDRLFLVSSKYKVYVFPVDNCQVLDRKVENELI